MTLLNLKNVSLCFDDGMVVKDLSFQMQAGECYGIIGESGSGKTQTALAIAGLSKDSMLPPQGELLFQDQPLYDQKGFIGRHLQGIHIGMVFQEPNTSLNPTMKIGKQVEEVLCLHTKMTKQERLLQVQDSLREVGLDDVARIMAAYPYELSGGMRQRVMIAAATIMRPALLIADEPSTALDVRHQAEILDLLKCLSAKHQMGILLISHDFDVISSICDRVLVMQQGVAVEEGSVRQVLEQPRHPYTKALIAAIPPKVDEAQWLRGGLRSGKCAVADDEIPSKMTLETSQAVLSCRNVTVSYREGKHRTTLLDNASFSIAPGEYVGLLGSSGSGKSSLCKALLGIGSYRSRGEITFAGKRPQMVFQDPFSSLQPKKTIGWSMAEVLRFSSIKNRENHHDGATKDAKIKYNGLVHAPTPVITGQIKAVLAKVSLSEELLTRYPSQLSGGQRQRVALALALLSGSPCIIADEPLSALDVSVQAGIIKLLQQLKQTEKLSMLFVSHDLDVVSLLCSRILLIEDGKLVEYRREIS